MKDIKVGNLLNAEGKRNLRFAIWRVSSADCIGNQRSQSSCGGSCLIAHRLRFLDNFCRTSGMDVSDLSPIGYLYPESRGLGLPLADRTSQQKGLYDLSSYDLYSTRYKFPTAYLQVILKNSSIPSRRRVWHYKRHFKQSIYPNSAPFVSHTRFRIYFHQF